MVASVPFTVDNTSFSHDSVTIKTADDNIVNYMDDPVNNAMLTDLLYEDLSGSELINISRHDIIDGTPVSYSLVSNLSDIQDMFNSRNIMSGFASKDTFFNQYTIDIMQRLNKIYFNDDGDLIIEFSNIESDENVELQIMVDGIIYTEN